MQSMTEVIKRKLELQGNMCFSDYMRLVLYHPELGYYTTKKRIIGKEGDFYTSANVGTIFGEALTERFINEVAVQGYFNILEYAAGLGNIALAMLEYLAKFYPDIYQKVTYYIIEISPEMRLKQLNLLEKHLGKVKWLASISDYKHFEGFIFANEFLDAMPVHILKYFKDGPQELYIYYKNGKIHKRYLEPTEEVKKYYHLLPCLPNGSIIEFCTDAFAWLQEVYDNSSNNLIYIVDYGYTIEQKTTIQRRKRLTLRCFKNHKIFSNPFAEMGQRDITADVDFSTLSNFAENIGFKTSSLINQGKFILKSGLYEKLVSGKEEFSQDKALESKLHALKQLVFPGAMGEAFEVLKLSKIG